MKRIKEIRLENFSDIAKIMEEVRVQPTESNDCNYERVYLVGIETIKKFEDTYDVRFPKHSWAWADSAEKNMKIHGSAKFVYVGEIHIYADCRDWQTEEYKRPRFSTEHIQRVVEYKNHLMTTGCSHRDKTYRFYLFNEIQDTSLVETEYPQRVGTLTDKKADAWLNCLLDEKNRIIEAANANFEKVKQFKNELAELTKRPIDDFSGDSGYLHIGMFKIHWSCDVKKGFTSLSVDFYTGAKGANGEFLTDFDRIKILSDAGLLK